MTPPNVTLGDKPQELHTDGRDQATGPGEVTYSEVQFRLEGSGDQKKSDNDHDVTYSEVKLSEKDDPGEAPQFASNDCSGQHTSGCGPSQGTGLEMKASSHTSRRHTALLLYLCVLLALAIAMTVLYVLKKQAHADVKQQHENATSLNKDLEIKLIETERELRVQEDALRCEVQMCENGWTKFREKWYTFSSNQTTWNESRNACQNMGGDLIIIDTEEKTEFIKQQTGDNWWIGATDAVDEGRWLWVDNTPLATNSTLWKRGQPDNYSDPQWGDPVHGEDCAVWVEGGLNDAKCYDTKNSICEVQC